MKFSKENNIAVFFKKINHKMFQTPFKLSLNMNFFWEAKPKSLSVLFQI